MKEEKTVDRNPCRRYFVHTMNEIALTDDLIRYQTERLQNVIGEIIGCCEDRHLYEAQKFGVPFAEVKVLLLFQGERYLTVKGIAKRLDLAKSRVTKIIDGLIDKGLVERISDPKDARVKLMSLTLQGQKKSAMIDDFHKEIHSKILLQLQPDERKQLILQLDVLRSAMESVKKQLQ